MWLPGNVVINYLEHYVFGSDAIWKSAKLLYVGATLFALSRVTRDQTVTYVQAMAAGLRVWPRLFVARIAASLLVLLGLVALVIPGFVLLVRYALLDSVVVLEGATATLALKRSATLTAGMRWQIFGAGGVFLLTFFVFSLILYVLVELAGGNIFVSIAVDCVLNVAFGLITIVLFLFYLEARRNEQDGVRQ